MRRRLAPNRVSPKRSSLLLLPLILGPILLVSAGAGLPEAGPVPEAKPGASEPLPLPADSPKTEAGKKAGASAEGTSTDGQPVEPEKAGDVPKPEAKPLAPETETVPPKPDAATSEPTSAPQPAEPAPVDPKAKPDAAAQPKPEAEAPAEPKTTTPAAELVITPEVAGEYAQCLTDLKALGATFEEKPRIDDGKGCGIDKPISVSQVLPGIKLAPEATMRCEAALELARWTKEAVLPAAKVAMAEDGTLTTINQASSYICRLRNNMSTGKISEHARGNAIDIASFTFKNGETITIQPRDEDGTLPGAFQRAVTATGCLYFETVLDPGSDEAHENHLHFDVLQRRGNYRYCR
jgi:hypothetical protein